MTAPVSHVGGMIDVAKVAQSVVDTVTVDVVDFFSLFVMGKEPRDPVRVIPDATKANANVYAAAPAIPRPAGLVAYFDAAVGFLYPGEKPGVGVVLDELADRIRDRFHAASMPCITRELYHG